MNDISRLTNFIGKANWLVLILLELVLLPLADPAFFWGAAAGGIIVGVNFHLLHKTIQGQLNPEGMKQSKRSFLWKMLIRYYIRFFISAVLIFILISNHWVHPLALLAGSSVVVVSVFLGTIVLVTQSLFKEAV